MDIWKYHERRSWLFSPQCFWRSQGMQCSLHLCLSPCWHHSYCKIYHSHRFSFLSILTSLASLIYDFTITWRLLEKLDCKLRMHASWKFNYNKTDNMCSLVEFFWLSYHSTICHLVCITGRNLKEVTIALRSYSKQSSKLLMITHLVVQSKPFQLTRSIQVTLH